MGKTVEHLAYALPRGPALCSDRHNLRNWAPCNRHRRRLPRLNLSKDFTGVLPLFANPDGAAIAASCGLDISARNYR